jgi:hypothetical protein
VAVALGLLRRSSFVILGAGLVLGLLAAAAGLPLPH